ncbi:efflux RND transporter periplasmic adaptor subunit [Halopseudomonas formosensis]|uniref:Efflux RND transporter periplasmic adaptor subunit n=1 Tax=Halopseudomonas formosensis TaxID=1002526 RepID=A0ABU5BVW5_9GAMM|nr:efflux RND transporter periplasmic adaptor subunit [Halopseudomonas formosensis]MDX9686917.1 efflux RND transporter periplasmic adaptor subunit [Halopseudomonas formosensis]
MPRIRRWLPILLALVLLLLWFAWRQWQGPEIPAYQLEQRPLVQRVVASGEVDSQSLAQVGSEITGVVKARHVREGDAVRAGDLLIELHDEEQQARLREAEAALRQLVQSQRPQTEAALREAQFNLAQASRERERREALVARQLLPAEQGEQARQAEISARSALQRAQAAAAAAAPGGSDEQLLQQRLAAARAALERTRIRARFDGVVQVRAVEPGDVVQPGTALLQIARADSREILVPLDEKELGPVAVGQPALIIADAYPTEVLEGRVSFIAPAVDTNRGTIDVHLELLESADFLRQGMTVSVDIRTASRDQALVIPNDALFNRRGDSAEVLRLAGGRLAERVPVRLGLRGTGLTEVVEGVGAGDVLLTDEQAEGRRVRARIDPLREDRRE